MIVPSPLKHTSYWLFQATNKLRTETVPDRLIDQAAFVTRCHSRAWGERLPAKPAAFPLRPPPQPSPQLYSRFQRHSSPYSRPTLLLSRSGPPLYPVLMSSSASRTSSATPTASASASATGSASATASSVSMFVPLSHSPFLSSSADSLSRALKPSDGRQRRPHYHCKQPSFHPLCWPSPQVLTDPGD